jgi:hypothetical protein
MLSLEFRVQSLDVWDGKLESGTPWKLDVGSWKLEAGY